MAALGELRGAIEAEDLTALRRTWVSLGGDEASGFEHWFEQVRETEVRYELQSVSRAGEALVARVQTTYGFYDASSGERERRAFEQMLELRSRDGRWVVVGSRQ
ncbi:MAG: hypothetical protein ABR599_04820 [Gemmatimonadota bacterium]